MQRLTSATWHRTIPQDFLLILRLLGRATFSLLTFEIKESRLALIVAWMTIRCEHEALEDDDES